MRRGALVTIVASIMQPWGWPRYPKTRKPQIDVPAGTRGIVVETSGLLGPTGGSVEVDYVLDGKLYRTLFERQYVKEDKVTR